MLEFIGSEVISLDTTVAFVAPVFTAVVPYFHHDIRPRSVPPRLHAAGVNRCSGAADSRWTVAWGRAIRGAGAAGSVDRQG
ncbi:hypothetical protein GCM10010199_02680 [Dactylosporangium roseum]